MAALLQRGFRGKSCSAPTRDQPPYGPPQESVSLLVSRWPVCRRSVMHCTAVEPYQLRCRLQGGGFGDGRPVPEAPCQRPGPGAALTGRAGVRSAGKRRDPIEEGILQQADRPDGQRPVHPARGPPRDLPDHLILIDVGPGHGPVAAGRLDRTPVPCSYPHRLVLWIPVDAPRAGGLPQVRPVSRARACLLSSAGAAAAGARQPSERGSGRMEAGEGLPMGIDQASM